jgi:hypothetical protein
METLRHRHIFSNGQEIVGGVIAMKVILGMTRRATSELPLRLPIIKKTVHAVSIIPPLITLDEDNNDTSFVAVEANDGANWSFTNVDTDDKIRVVVLLQSLAGNRCNEK